VLFAKSYLKKWILEMRIIGQIALTLNTCRKSGCHRCAAAVIDHSETKCFCKRNRSGASSILSLESPKVI
jgi:hypothetical protein